MLRVVLLLMRHCSIAETNFGKGTRNAPGTALATLGGIVAGSVACFEWPACHDKNAPKRTTSAPELALDTLPERWRAFASGRLGLF